MILFAYVWFFTFYYPNTKYDVVMVLIFAVIIFVAFHAEVGSGIDNKIIRYMSNASYAIYLLQVLWLQIFRLLIPWEKLFTASHMIVFVLINFVSGIILYEGMRRLGKVMNKRK